MKKEYLDLLDVDSVEEIDWIYISEWQKLSEDFMREFKDKVYWDYISRFQKLSEGFIREFQDRLNWNNISYYQKLSEDFIREFRDYVDWDHISYRQTLSEDFIREFEDYVNWYNISQYQKLSEPFIREFKNKVDWINISYYKKLSEDFIREFKDYVDWYYISYSQILSESFIEEFFDELHKHNWEYATKKKKTQIIKNSGLYEIDGDYILAYKTTKKDGYSVYNPNKYQYKIGKIYESDCDCNIRNENSFGLSAWTKEGALKYYSYGELYKVKIHIDDVGAFIQNNGKLRCFKIEILERIQ